MNFANNLIDDLKRVESEFGFILVGATFNGVGPSTTQLFFPVPAEHIGVEPVNSKMFQIHIETEHDVAGCENTLSILLNFRKNGGIQYDLERKVYTIDAANPDSEVHLSLYIGGKGENKVAPNTFNGARQEKVKSFC